MVELCVEVSLLVPLTGFLFWMFRLGTGKVLTEAEALLSTQQLIESSIRMNCCHSFSICDMRITCP